MYVIVKAEKDGDCIMTGYLMLMGDKINLRNKVYFMNP